MDWHALRAEVRSRYVAKYNATEAASYDRMPGMGCLTRVEEDACLSDLQRVFDIRQRMRVLDVGAGTGALCSVLTRLPGLSITALEPAPAMLAVLRSKAGLAHVVTVQGFCDGVDDRRHFGESQFDVVVARQVVNGLFDPLTGFRNWRHWLAPGGSVIVLDGLYGRDGWVGQWQEELDLLPLSACQTTALTPYLLTEAGFRIDAVDWMVATNALPSTRTARYVVVATKPA